MFSLTKFPHTLLFSHSELNRKVKSVKNCKAKIELLGSYDPQKQLIIKDPYYVSITVGSEHLPAQLRCFLCLWWCIDHFKGICVNMDRIYVAYTNANDDTKRIISLQMFLTLRSNSY